MRRQIVLFEDTFLHNMARIIFDERRKEENRIAGATCTSAPSSVKQQMMH